jgi:iron(III) transport system permease protein
MLAHRRPPIALLAVCALPALLVLLPIVYTFLQALEVPLRAAAHLIFRPLVGLLLLNTLTLTVTATLVAAVLGTAAAWLVERTRLPGRRLWGTIVVVPLAIPPFISSFAWISLTPQLQGFAGALLIVSTSYLALVYLPVAAALRGMDPALEETARALGESPWGAFRRVVLPQLRPALLGGMLLVALNTLVEFGAFALLRYRTFTTEIYAEYRIGFGGPQASLLAMILILLCAICLVAEQKVRGRRRYARTARGTRGAPVVYDLGWKRWPAVLAFTAFGAATLGMPFGMIAYWLTQHASAATAPALASLPRIIDATVSSVALGVAGAALTLLLALPLAFLTVRYDGRLTVILERTAYLAQGVPGIVVALALVSLTITSVRFLYQSAFVLIVAYAILFLPLALVAVRAALSQGQRNLEEAGRSLGLGWLAVVWRVVVPLAAPGLGAAAAMVFISVSTELTTTLILSPTGTRTLATQVWANTSALAFAAAAPYAALLAVMSLISSWLLARRFAAIALLSN